MRNRSAWVGGVIAATSVAAVAGWAHFDSVAEARARDKAQALATVEAMYDVISGAAGEQRDWDEFLSMFAEGGRLVFFTQGRPAMGDEPAVPARMVSWTPAEYMERAGAHMESNPFYERSTWNNAQVFGRMAHVMSAYETANEPGGEAVARGVNSVQLVRDPADPDAGWKVLMICWDSASPDRPIPPEMGGAQAAAPTGD